MAPSYPLSSRFIETESGIVQAPKVLESLNLLKETVEDDVEQLRPAVDPLEYGIRA